MLTYTYPDGRLPSKTLLREPLLEPLVTEQLAAVAVLLLVEELPVVIAKGGGSAGTSSSAAALRDQKDYVDHHTCSEN
jgi:pyruvate-formate lyase